MLVLRLRSGQALVLHLRGLFTGGPQGAPFGRLLRRCRCGPEPRSTILIPKGSTTMSKLRKPSLPRASKGQPAQPQPPKLDALAQINHHAAGLDIGDAEIYAAVPESAADPAVRVFGTFTTDLASLADWLAACKVDTVAMESTGVYWIPILRLRSGQVLRAAGRAWLPGLPGQRPPTQERLRQEDGHPRLPVDPAAPHLRPAATLLSPARRHLCPARRDPAPRQPAAQLHG